MEGLSEGSVSEVPAEELQLEALESEYNELIAERPVRTSEFIKASNLDVQEAKKNRLAYIDERVEKISGEINVLKDKLHHSGMGAKQGE